MAIKAAQEKLANSRKDLRYLKNLNSFRKKYNIRISMMKI